MSVGMQAVTRPVPPNGVELTELCNSLFWCFSRSDQRRWAEVYVRGLVTVPGRKSIRRIAEEIIGYRTDQSLQQFLNQSPWSAAAVRCNLAHRVSSALGPRAWVLNEVAIPKYGDRSVAVARQYAHSLGRTANCQLGIVASLATEQGGCPVNWRLALPRSWEDDERRARAHVPDDERPQPWWRYALDLVDEMAGDWALPQTPVIVDGRHDLQVEPLLRGLDERKVRYAVQVAGGALARPGGVRPAALPAGTRPLPVAEVAAAVPRMRRATVAWWDGAQDKIERSQFAVVPIAGEQEVYGIGPGRTYRSPRRIVAEWPTGQTRPSGLWITNLNTARLPDLVTLLRMRDQVDVDMRRLAEESGLRDFEGRSFQGWHHHVTLVSVAHAYRLLHEAGEGK